MRLIYSVSQNGLLETAERRARVIDTVPPVIASTTVEVPCGWASSTADPQQQRCVRIVGTANDTCSTPAIEVVLIREFLNGGSNILLRESQGTNCIHADPAYQDGALEALEYEVTWRARDSWGNSTDRIARFKIRDHLPPNGVCAEPREVEFFFDRSPP